jgi:hypothetical protein
MKEKGEKPENGRAGCVRKKEENSCPVWSDGFASAHTESVLGAAGDMGFLIVSS